ncbi:3-hydroxyacyl-CoA dehydrogenase [Mesorhizobium alhagi CCNWXJ12-2]|uniref:3-hydroxyacyl-CoA dehydrogenase n=1 Tax=Mesorhizobium alhagi CCNWXJ12-2 TaxID=1107882 RepID=H0I236_9HYPH|nr:3-hydroxyacyl-CoA dehydrogenase [Mesorhizobium alhagi CCNWXJ12-2]
MPFSSKIRRPDMDVQDQALLVMVTGEGSKLDAATARALAKKGARVAILDIDAEKGEAAAREAGGIFAHCDVADPVSAAEALAASRAAHSAPAILVNCAAIGTAARAVARGALPHEAFERVIRVNLPGTFNMMRLAAAGMSAAEPGVGGARGAIMSTASVTAFEGQIGQAGYAASKGGIAALTLPVTRELARFGIRVLTIAPGLFKTPLLAELPQEAQGALGGAIPYPARADLARRIRASGRGHGRGRLSERRNRASRRRAQDAAEIGPFRAAIGWNTRCGRMPPCWSTRMRLRSSSVTATRQASYSIQTISACSMPRRPAFSKPRSG